MAHSDKNIVITPARSDGTQDPKIVFSGADAATGAQNITMKVYPTGSGTIKFESSAGQLISISAAGTIFSVNYVPATPSIEVLDTGLIRLAQYSGFVAFGNNSAVTAAGSTQATATVLARQINYVTAGSGGVRLPVPVGGERVLIRNSLGSSIIVYPGSGAQINDSGTNVGVGHSSASMLEYVAVSSTQWYTLNSTYA